MSPRAAWRLDALGFEQVNDYVAGKADWLAHGLPREGERSGVPYAGDLLDREPPTCSLADTVADLRTRLEDTRIGFCIVLNDQGVVLGRVRRRTLEAAQASATAEAVMEPGPTTVRPSTPARDLIERLRRRELRTAIVTTPGGRLLGVFERDAAEQRLAP